MSSCAMCDLFRGCWPLALGAKERSIHVPAIVAGLRHRVSPPSSAHGGMLAAQQLQQCCDGFLQTGRCRCRSDTGLGFNVSIFGSYVR